MSWGNWAHRAFVLGSGAAVAAAAFLTVPLGADAAPTTPTTTPPAQPISIGLGGLAVNVGGLNISVGTPSASSNPSSDAGGTIAGTISGIVGTAVGSVDGLLGPRQPATQPVQPRPVTPTSPTSVTLSPSAQPTHEPTYVSGPPASHPATIAPAHGGRAPSAASDPVPTTTTSGSVGPNHPLASAGQAVRQLGSAAQARRRDQAAVQQVLANALHPGGAALMLAAITAIIAVGIAAVIVSFGRRPGVSITGQMID